jgi:hypothetical protein
LHHNPIAHCFVIEFKSITRLHLGDNDFQVVEIVDVVRRYVYALPVLEISKALTVPLGVHAAWNLTAEIMRLVSRTIPVIRFCGRSADKYPQGTSAGALGTDKLTGFQLPTGHKGMLPIKQ